MQRGGLGGKNHLGVEDGWSNRKRKQGGLIPGLADSEPRAGRVGKTYRVGEAGWGKSLFDTCTSCCYHNPIVKTINEELTESLKSRGASLAGFADLQEINPEVRDNFPFGISIAVALNPNIIAGIKDGPNQEYYEEYKRANHLLDTIGKYTAEFLEHKGYHATSSPATNAGIDWRTLSTRLPHKTIATRAGLGWIGKCAVLVTREFGSAVRLTSVLTDAPVIASQPVDTSACGDCSECVDKCPGQAISGNEWLKGIPRKSLLDAFACRKTAQEFEKVREGVHNNICGICIAACPWTMSYLESH